MNIARWFGSHIMSALVVLVFLYIIFLANDRYKLPVVSTMVAGIRG